MRDIFLFEGTILIFNLGLLVISLFGRGGSSEKNCLNLHLELF